MNEKSSYFLIPPLALYILSVAQQDESEEILARHAKFTWEFTPPVYLQAFKETAAIYGDPYIISDECIAKFFSHLPKKDHGIGNAFVNMIKELRYTMDTLTTYPILVDTGQYKPKKQDRTHLEMENEIANRLTQQANYQAKVKLLDGEHAVRTKEPLRSTYGSGVTTRISQIKARMRQEGRCKHYLDVEKEIRERQAKWRDGGGGKQRPGGPPPSFG
jgi:hypothetical protein